LLGYFSAGRGECPRHGRLFDPLRELAKEFTGGEGRAASWGGGAVDAGYVDAYLAAALTRVMRAAVPIPAVAAASVLHSAAVGGSVVGDVGPL